MDESTFMEPSQEPSRSKAAHQYSLEHLNAREHQYSLEDLNARVTNTAWRTSTLACRLLHQQRSSPSYSAWKP